MRAKYKVGDVVQIINTQQVGTVTRVAESDTSVAYYIMIGGKKKRFKEEDLTPYVDTEDSIFQHFEEHAFGGADQMQQFVYYRQFSESRDKSLYSHQGNRIIFNPFQYKPLLKFLSIDSDERLLVADEVGVGKTIETGIILDELFARGDIQNRDTILVVCPNILCRKWQDELGDKFQMKDFQILDSRLLKYYLNRIKEGARNLRFHGIVSEQLIRGEAYLELLQECRDEVGEPFIQFLIIDECHHYRNPETNTHRIGRILSMCAERVVMLSATPYNLDSADLFNQLHLLNPFLFPDEKVFHELAKQIRNVNRCISLLRDRSGESDEEMMTLLNELQPLINHNETIENDLDELRKHISRGDVLDIKQVVRYENTLKMLNPLASSFTRTLKREALEHRVTREVRTLDVQFTEAEAKIYQDFIDVNMLRHELNGVSEKAFGLIANGLERIAASSVVALERNIASFMKKADLDFEEILQSDLGLDESSADTMRDLLAQRYRELIDQIHALNGVDTKYSTFKQLIQNIHNASPENPRILVFSFYVGTLKYLRKKLTEDGYRVALMYGKTPLDTPSQRAKDEDGFPVIGRTDLMAAFKKGDFDILLVSEVGGEGLDFQFCTSMINYDLPYNPMRIEQRIGRIDRMGQMADKIIIGNLCIENTIDMVIKSVLLARIADATDLLGDLEPIITQEMEEINQLIIRKEFTPEELAKREKEILARIEKERLTREEFDKQRYELVNDKGFRDEFEEAIKGSRISPRDSLLFTTAFLKGINGCWTKQTGDASGIIHITKDLRDKLKSYSRRMDTGSGGLEINKICDAPGDIAINFNGDDAYLHDDQLFVKPSGAWVHFMVDYLKVQEQEEPENLFHAALKKEHTASLKRGAYLIFIYDFEFNGFKDTNMTNYIIINPNDQTVTDIGDDEWKSIIQNVQNSKRPVDMQIEDIEDARAVADETSDEIMNGIQREMIGSNDIKIVSRIKAIRSLSEMRITEKENNLIGADEKEAEKIRREIEKEKKKMKEKLDILESKRKLGCSSSLLGLCVLDVI